MGARGLVSSTVQKPKYPWSVQQQAIFDWFSTSRLTLNTGTGSTDRQNPDLIVRARAGTGKTTTIIEGSNRAPEQRILVCAFNKKIADELNSRITNPRAQAKTLHALGYAAIRQQWGNIRVENNERGANLTDRVVEKGVPKPIRRLVTLLHTKGREMTPLEPTIKALIALALRFDYVPDEGWEGAGYNVEYVAGRALAAMTLAATEDAPHRTGIDYADMIYLPLVRNWLQPTYDLVVGDEAQDMNIAQLEIMQRVLKGRMCLVGDEKQAIYQFRGCDSHSLDRLKGELQAEELRLTVTYRCGQSIVRRAQTLVPDIQAAPANPEGTVDQADYETVIQQAQPGQFILSRLNAPLVSLTLALLRHGRRARMAGRDIGKGIQAILRKLGSQSSLEGLLVALETWERKTVTRFANYGQLDLVDRCHDQADMIRSLSEDCDTLEEMSSKCDWLFTDIEDGGQILCSSIHKAKGLEADRVWVLQESLYRRGPSPEEDNLAYVAWTRAKSHLTLVTGVPSLSTLR